MPSAVPVSRRRRRGLAWVVVVAIAIGAAATLTLKRDRVHAPTRSPAPAANVLLITVDTLRPDALGWVAGRNATPEIDRLAGDAFKFPGAMAPVPLTLPSHAALMTGLFPRRLGLRDNGQVVPPGPRTLAEALESRGYATAAFVSGYPLDSAFGLDRGFDVYDDALSPGSDGDLERPADATLAAALRWLATAPAPRFAWVHFYDPHYPYEPPAAHRRPGPRGAYDGEVAYVDAAVGRLAAAFGARDDALIVFAADHGESLGEHGEGTHGFFIYDSTVVVPLFFRWPGRVASGSSPAAARLVDVAPTVLDLLGIPAAAAVDGVSLRATLAGGAAVAEPAYIETFQPWNSYGWSPLKAIRHRGLKLIAAPRPELYDLAIDPGETRNLIGERPSDASALARLLDAAQKRSRRRRRPRSIPTPARGWRRWDTCPAVPRAPILRPTGCAIPRTATGCARCSPRATCTCGAAKRRRRWPPSTPCCAKTPTTASRSTARASPSSGAARPDARCRGSRKRCGSTPRTPTPASRWRKR